MTDTQIFREKVNAFDDLIRENTTIAFKAHKGKESNIDMTELVGSIMEAKNLVAALYEGEDRDDIVADIRHEIHEVLISIKRSI